MLLTFEGIVAETKKRVALRIHTLVGDGHYPDRAEVLEMFEAVTQVRYWNRPELLAALGSADGQAVLDNQIPYKLQAYASLGAVALEGLREIVYEVCIETALDDLVRRTNDAKTYDGLLPDYECTACSWTTNENNAHRIEAGCPKCGCALEQGDPWYGLHLEPYLEIDLADFTL